MCDIKTLEILKRAKQELQRDPKATETRDMLSVCCL
jgi:hypothetical protein